MKFFLSSKNHFINFTPKILKEYPKFFLKTLSYKMNKTKILLIGLLLCSSHFYALGQASGFTNSNQSTQSINPSNGIFGHSVPLHQILNGTTSLPIKLSYSTSGRKVQDKSSWIGLDWSLSAGGSISRNVNGNPDDHIDGFLNVPINDVSNIEDLVIDVGDNLKDGEPDDFFVNVGSANFKFHFNEFGVPQIIGTGNYNISFTTDASGKIISFLVIDAQGIKYFFDNYETTTVEMFTYRTDNESLMGHPNYPSNLYETNIDSLNVEGGESYVSKWLLTKITDENDLNPIILNYNEVQSVNIDRGSISYYIETQEITHQRPSYTQLTTPSWLFFSYKKWVTFPGSISVTSEVDNTTQNSLKANLTVRKIEVNSKFPSEIIWKSGKVTFQKSTQSRLDLAYTDYALNNIKIYFQNKYIGGYKFINNSYFQSSNCVSGLSHECKRLKLSSIVKQYSVRNPSTGYSIEEHYLENFEYNLTPMPPRYSKAFDYWGFSTQLDINQQLVTANLHDGFIPDNIWMTREFDNLDQQKNYILDFTSSHTHYQSPYKASPFKTLTYNGQEYNFGTKRIHTHYNVNDNEIIIGSSLSNVGNHPTLSGTLSKIYGVFTDVEIELELNEFINNTGSIYTIPISSPRGNRAIMGAGLRTKKIISKTKNGEIITTIDYEYSDGQLVTMPQFASAQRDLARPATTLKRFYTHNDDQAERQIINLQTSWYSEAQNIPTIKGGFITYNQVSVINSSLGKTVTDFFPSVDHRTVNKTFSGNTAIGDVYNRPVINYVKTIRPSDAPCYPISDLVKENDNLINVGYSPFPMSPNYEWLSGLPQQVAVYDKNGNLESYSQYKYKIRNHAKTPTIKTSKTKLWDEVYCSSYDPGSEIGDIPPSTTWSTSGYWSSSYIYSKNYKNSGWIDATEIKTHKDETDKLVTFSYNDNNAQPIEVKIGLNSSFSSGGNPTHQSNELEYKTDDLRFITNNAYAPTMPSTTYGYSQGPLGMERALEIIRDSKFAKSTEIESIQYKEKNNVSQIISANLRTFKLVDHLGDLKVVPDKVYALKLTEPLEESMFTKSYMDVDNSTAAVPILTFHMDPRYELISTFSSYDDYLKVDEMTSEDGNIVSTVVGYGGSRIVAKAINSILTDFASTSFENGEEELNDWFQGGILEHIDEAHTGEQYLRSSLNVGLELTSKEITTSSNEEYWATFFSRFNGSTGEDATARIDVIYQNNIVASVNKSIGTGVEWLYNELSVDLAEIKSSNAISSTEEVTMFIVLTSSSSANQVDLDDVRIQPRYASVESYTYDEFGVITSTLFEDNDCIKIEYDHLGRRKLLRNCKGEIVKLYEYGFFTSPTSSTGTNTGGTGTVNGQ